MIGLVKCTSSTCIYRSSCLRQVTDNPPKDNQEYFNFEYTCNINSGFSEYELHVHNK